MVPYIKMVFLTLFSATWVHINRNRIATFCPTSAARSVRAIYLLCLSLLLFCLFNDGRRLPTIIRCSVSPGPKEEKSRIDNLVQIAILVLQINPIVQYILSFFYQAKKLYTDQVLVLGHYVLSDNAVNATRDLHVRYVSHIIWHKLQLIWHAKADLSAFLTWTITHER